MSDEKKFSMIENITDVLESLKGIEGAAHERIDAAEIMIASLSQLVAQQESIIGTMHKTNVNLLEALTKLTERVVKLEGCLSLNYSFVKPAAKKDIS